MTEPVSKADAGTMTALADLHLNEERAAAVAGLLSAWLPAANELSRKMSAPEFQETMPITVLVHPDHVESGE